MKVYAAIGHFKGEKNITCVALTANTKKSFMTDCYGNEFVPYVVITESMFERLRTYVCDPCADCYDLVKKMTTNYRVWSDVADYIQDCFNIIGNKMTAAREYETI